MISKLKKFNLMNRQYLIQTKKNHGIGHLTSILIGLSNAQTINGMIHRIEQKLFTGTFSFSIILHAIRVFFKI